MHCIVLNHLVKTQDFLFWLMMTTNSQHAENHGPQMLSTKYVTRPSRGWGGGEAWNWSCDLRANERPQNHGKLICSPWTSFAPPGLVAQTNRQTDRQTDRQTNMATLWLNRPLWPIQWKPANYPAKVENFSF